MSVQARYCAAATGATIDKKVQTTDVKLLYRIPASNVRTPHVFPPRDKCEGEET